MVLKGLSFVSVSLVVLILVNPFFIRTDVYAFLSWTATRSPSYAKVQIEHYYANDSSTQLCFVQLYEKYLSRCTESGVAKDAFYLTLRRGLKYFDDGKF